MKKVFIATCCLAFALGGCLKKGTTEVTCEVSVFSVAGNYKITKIENISGGSVTDVTDTYLSACQKDNVFQLMGNKTAIYQDAGTVCSPAADGTGTWDIVDGKLTVTTSGTGLDITNALVFNSCSYIVLEESNRGASIRVTLVRI